MKEVYALELSLLGASTISRRRNIGFFLWKDCECFAFGGVPGVVFEMANLVGFVDLLFRCFHLGGDVVALVGGALVWTISCVHQHMYARAVNPRKSVMFEGCIRT